MLSKSLPKTLYEGFEPFLKYKWKEFYNPDIANNWSDEEWEQYSLRFINSKSSKYASKDEVRAHLEKLTCESKIAKGWLNQVSNPERDRFLKTIGGMNHVQLEEYWQTHPTQQKAWFDYCYLSNVAEHSTIESESEEPRLSGISIYAKYWASVFRALFGFYHSGKKVFRIEENLMNELLLTDVSKIDDAFLNLPFRDIAIYLPYNNSLTMRKTLIRWIYIRQREENQELPEYNVILRNRIKKITFVFEDAEGRLNGREFKFAGGDIKAQTKKQILEKNHSPLAIKELWGIMSFTIAMLLYMKSESVYSQEVRKSSVLMNRNDSKYPCCSLGGDIIINHFHHYNVNNTIASTEEIKRQMHVVKWTVRGHFRAYTSDRFKDKKTIWIRPYLKGKERSNERVTTKPSSYQLQ